MNLADFLSLFSLPFMQRAVIGGVLLGILGGILGSFLILRRLSLFGDTVGHSAMLGVVLAALLQLPTTWTLIGFTVAFGLGVIYLIDRTDLGSDTVLCVSLSGSIALGTIGFSYLKGYRGNLLSILFGDILAISNTELNKYHKRGEWFEVDVQIIDDILEKLQGKPNVYGIEEDLFVVQLHRSMSNLEKPRIEISTLRNIVRENCEEVLNGWRGVGASVPLGVYKTKAEAEAAELHIRWMLDLPYVRSWVDKYGNRQSEEYWLD